MIADLEPSTIVNIGDDVDCYTISSFDKDPRRLHSLQDEINNTRAHLHKVSQLAPEANKYWLEGNHEDRFRRLIWRLPGAAVQLAALDVFQQAMTWPSLVRTEEIGWDFITTSAQSKKDILPKLIVKHGTQLARYSGGTAQLEWKKYGKSGLSGHSHRLGSFFHRDHNGNHVWQETGCLCKLDAEYETDPDWQQGLVVVEHTADGSRFGLYPVYFQGGKAIYQKVLYSA